METPFILFIMNVLMSIAMLFGGIVIKGAIAEIKALREADTDMRSTINENQTKIRTELHTATREITDKLGQYTHKDDFKEFRDEQRQNFKTMFDKMDKLGEQVSNKADR